MADFFEDNLGYELTDCTCGGKPKLMLIPVIHAINQRVYLYFSVQCTNCGRTCGLFVDEGDAVFHWNQYMKGRSEEYL